MSTPPPVDIDVLRDEIQKTYTGVSERREEEFIFPTGRAWAEDLGYPAAFLQAVPEATVESFAGVANHFVLGDIDEGDTVLDLGCGAGTDLLIAAQMAGSSGRAIGIDITPSMAERARQSAAEMGLDNVEVREGLIEELPLPDQSVDVVISNGVIDREVSEEAKRDIDLWTG
jgi:SAM-dependent methyltransferase